MNNSFAIPRTLTFVIGLTIIFFALAACASSTTPLPAQSTARASQPTAAAQVVAPPTNCNNNITPAQTEGPYYKANTPELASLIAPGMTGTQVTVTGYVLARDCKPIARAWLDFWQANDKGEYDNAGYTLRGHQFTDASGHYALETILPGLYPGRTRHLHVKVQAPNQAILTTQLYFPEEKQNSADGIFDSKLVITWQDSANRKIALYNFVLNAN